MEILAKTFIIPAGKVQFIQEITFNNAPVRQIAITVKTNSAFTASYTEIPFSYEQIVIRPNRIPRGGQPIVGCDTVNSCRLYVTTMEAMNFQSVIPTIPIDKFKENLVLVFNLTSMLDAVKKILTWNSLGNHLRWS